MYKNDNIFSIIILVVISILSYFIQTELSSDILTSLMTFLSIYFGFLITSFSILISSEEIKKLYKKADPEDNAINLLERLANYYKVAISSCILSVIIMLLLLIFNITQIFFIILGLVIYSIYPMRMIFKILFDVFTNKKIY